MPFVQRNWKGEITGLFANAQGYATEELPDDNPEIIAYRTKHPVPPELLKPPTKEELQRFSTMMREDELERKRIRNAVMSFHGAFSSLETALSTLLYAILHIPDSQLAYAIYYSPTSFDARAELVNNALIQITTEQSRLADLLPHWKKINDKMQQIRNLRNAVAHSSLLTFSINGKFHTRLSPPAFDVIRVGRKKATRQIPGLSGHDIWQGTRKARWLSERIDDVNRLVTEFRDGNPSLREKYAALEAGLRADRSPESAGRTPSES
jgi:hypothetical protein